MPVEKFLLPVGRIVSGHPAKSQIKENFQTKQPVLRDGKQVQEWRCQIAIPKAEFAAHVWPVMYGEAIKMYTAGVGVDFSWKYIDGDSHLCPKGSTVPYNTREGFPGHYVLKISTEAFQPKIFKREANDTFREMQPDEIDTGCFVQGSINILAHNNNDGGLYLNPNGYEFIAYGPKIAQQGVNAKELFHGSGNHPLPAGASLTPIGMQGAPLPLASPTHAAMPVTQPAPGYPPQAAPAPMPAPAHDFVRNAAGAPAGYAPPSQGAGYPAAPGMPGMPAPR